MSIEPINVHDPESAQNLDKGSLQGLKDGIAGGDVTVPTIDKHPGVLQQGHP